ncbi:MAG: SUMF1/EgtB/PvdO family nonheme iron enzyme [Candidatus Electrothrix sp. GW3-4]|uniref:SUMF1/EgtB/PvdO family nonheme iron enzyme n=1 Tax=Candidatus Electrothrix sp. GW3-4 TaxID=3126740 RepID=UPI0030CFBE4A
MLTRFLYILLVLAITVPVQAASPYGDFHALVIGIEKYQHLTPLKTPIADAKAVAGLLKEQYGFTVQLVLNPDRDQLEKAVYDLRRTMTGEEDSLLIYYAGHGFLDKTTGVDYWQPVNAQRNSELYWVPTSRITDTLRAIRVRHVLVVADSCYSGSLLRDSGAKLAAGMSRDRFLQRMLQRRSRTALTSGGEEPVLDSGGSGHSVFAWVFLEVLRKNRELLEGDSLFDLIKRPVALKADQTPLYGDIRKAGQDVEQGDFIFVPKVLQNQTEPPLLVQAEKRGRGDFARRGNNGQSVGQRSGKVEPVRFSVPQQGDTITDPITDMEFVSIPKGCFQMGSNKSGYDDEKPVHEVCVDGFWMGKYEVTQGQWQKIMGENPAKFKKGDKYPVEQVSWEDVQGGIAELNNKSGRKYRLPTEAEWEYAARAGTAYKYSGGDNSDAVAWYYGNSGDSTRPVGEKKANTFGLYDMSGNVCEWCGDWYANDYYGTIPKDNPTGPSSGSFRVVRGGSWNFGPESVRSAYRNRYMPDDYGPNLGFRLVLPVQQGR